MSNVGAPTVGDQPGFSIDTSLGTQIERYQVVQVSTATTGMEVGLCGTSTANQALATGVAFRSWPYVPQIYDVAGRRSTDISTYDTEKKKRIAIREEGFSWIKCEIPSGGNTVTVNRGDWLVPSPQSAGGIEARGAPVSTLTATYNSSTIEADLQGEDTKDRNVLAKAHSLVVIPPSGASWPWPTLDPAWGTHTATLTALTNAITFGYVFSRIGKG